MVNPNKSFLNPVQRLEPHWPIKDKNCFSVNVAIVLDDPRVRSSLSAKDPVVDANITCTLTREAGGISSDDVDFHYTPLSSKDGCLHRCGTD